MTIICLLKMDSKKCISYFANLKWSHYLVLQPNKHLGDARSGTNRHKDSPVGQLSAHLLVEGILMQNISLNICTGGSRLVVCWMILLCTVYNPNQIVSYTVTPLSGFKENMTWVSHHDWRLGQLQQEVGQPIDGFLQRDFSSAQKKKALNLRGLWQTRTVPLIIGWDLNEGMLIKGGLLASRAITVGMMHDTYWDEEVS